MKRNAKVISIDSAPVRRSEIVDEFGRLSAKIAELKSAKDRYDQLRKQIAGWYESADPEGTFTEEGTCYSVEIGARKFERVITSMKKLKAYLGLTKFLELCSFTLSAIDEHVPVEDRAPFVDCTRTGSREIKPIAKNLPETDERAA